MIPVSASQGQARTQGAASTIPESSATYSYRCEDGAHGEITYRNFTDGRSEATLAYLGRTVEMSEERSASGAMYKASDGSGLVFWSKGHEAFIERDDVILHRACKMTEET
ncbi:MliC family protein [Ruegeria pomeroyi]|nr:MliC family protein [Ruegeria pomeroyi]